MKYPLIDFSKVIKCFDGFNFEIIFPLKKINFWFFKVKSWKCFSDFIHEFCILLVLILPKKFKQTKALKRKRNTFQNFYHLQLNRIQVRIYSTKYISEVSKVIRDSCYSSESWIGSLKTSENPAYFFGYFDSAKVWKLMSKFKNFIDFSIF